MVNPGQLELLANAVSLAATYLQSREDRRASVSAEDFRQWLEHQAFPNLLKQAEQTLQTVVSTKAHQREQYDIMLEHLIAIRLAVAGSSDRDRWAALSDVDRRILLALFDAAREDPAARLKISDIANEEEESSGLKASAKYLDEQGLLHLSEVGGYSVRGSAKGMGLAWACSDPGYEQALQALRSQLPESPHSERLHGLATKTGLPIGLVAYTVSAWAEKGLLKFQGSASPWQYGLVYNVSETLRRDGGKSRA